MSDDDNEICPLCCEELDLSDQSFYPCKCGYQVCMWCWHRIRETESGLCPACRTPYGDDPHEFSAVDMEEVVKANKEKMKAEKRERELLKAQREQEVREGIVQEAKADVGGWGEHARLAHEADLSSVLASKGPPEPPKDRSVLATMRVIRRNLVYAVGMPPNIATEELLRKPEYFGQYGKIAKIVINRNHNPGDPRRASASAYVTFVHKEDTLACILALDGFYYDGRNIRASYGTSKYCSAFIKSVKCNNPDCTYLHHMGDAEDTFTKQEIQAGYVTSGRDVLARQQQIMAQLQNAVGSSGRKKVGGGGPSGTGKASANPVFPPPSYDEPLPRASLKSVQVQQRIRLGGGPTPAVAATISAPISGPSAASIVAGNHNPTPAPPAAHQTLTPLKRSGSIAKPIGLAGSSLDLTPAESLALQKQREEQLAQQQREMSRRQSDGAALKFPSSPSSSVGSGASKGELKQNGSIGGTQIGAIGAIGAGTIGGASIPMGSSLFGGGYSSNIGSASNALDFGTLGHATGSGALGGQPIQMPSDDTKPGLIGGISLAPTNNPFSLDSLLSGSSAQPTGGDEWGAVGGSAGQTGLFGNSSSFGMSSGGIWGDDPANSQKRSNPAPIGSNRSNGAGSNIGGTSLFGNSNPFGNGSGSSALASMLGIELPTGSGSLRESGLFPGQSNGRQTAFGSLSNSNAVGAIGAKSNNMMPIGAPSSQGITIGSYNNGGNNSDMALLQSLLPGVNITSGAAPQQVGSLQGTQLGGDKWNGSGVLSQQQYSKDEQQRSGNIW
ncbi:hypothetical protein ACHAWO_009913 [Cyclotella atomus]|uniref:CCR4-NOT transcription complex subunit 4 n=1 Tax=Cyclotella atomus TaxID=382360 RepID=A0ABD3N0U6_9STRA